MRFLSTAYTDVGIRKHNNQDSALLMEADTDCGRVLLAVLCDGMGGLAKGEIASSTVILAYQKKKKNVLPSILTYDNPEKAIFNAWDAIITDCNRRIAAYAESHYGNSMGTTLTAILFLRGRYYLVNVGDSRAYLATDGLYQLTKDHSFVQREVDMGRMTPAEALVSPRRNVLLQCVGASSVVRPDYFSDDCVPNQVFMLCSDGFRHAVSPQELYQYLNPAVLTDEKAMRENAAYLTELNKSRNETDNITVLLVKTI